VWDGRVTLALYTLNLASARQGPAYFAPVRTIARMDDSELFLGLGLAVLVLGLVIVIQPSVGARLLALEFHDRMANRFPALYRSIGWTWLTDERTRRLLFTRAFGIAVLILGIVLIVQSPTDG
jgi:uncharacterized membrane protein HdeD (DUF308 family)